MNKGRVDNLSTLGRYHIKRVRRERKRERERQREREIWEVNEEKGETYREDRLIMSIYFSRILGLSTSISTL